METITCDNCEVITDDYRDTLCKDCDKQGEVGNCDTCGSKYELSSRDGRCGDCGDCSDHCEHTCLHENWVTGLGGDRWCVACGEPEHSIRLEPKGE